MTILIQDFYIPTIVCHGSPLFENVILYMPYVKNTAMLVKSFNETLHLYLVCGTNSCYYQYMDRRTELQVVLVKPVYMSVN